MKKKLAIVATIIALSALVLAIHLATRDMNPQRLLQQLHGG